MRLALLVLLAGCGGVQTSGFDTGPVDAGPPAAGASCPESSRGFGACSADAGDLPECRDAGWTVLVDCHSGTPCADRNGYLSCGSPPADAG